MSNQSDAVVIGAGHNALATAIILAKAGWSVAVLERNDHPGGAVRTAEATLPGFRHDLYATNLNIIMGSAFFEEFKDDLFANGFGVVPAAHPFASAFPNGKWVGVSTDQEETVAGIAAHSKADVEAWGRLGGWFGELAPTLFGVLGSPMPSRRAVFGQRKILRKQWRELSRLALQSTREFTEENFESPEVQALVASWGMHLDYPPDVSGGAVFALLETFAAAAHGMAHGAGGAGCLIDAMVATLEGYGGRLITGVDVTEVIVADGKATGVVSADGERYEATRAVVASTGPKALYDNLLPSSAVPAEVAERARKYRYGPGTMMVHVAVDDLPDWTASKELRKYAYVHLGPYMGDMGIAAAQAAAGLIPSRPTVVVGQPTAVDPSRAPDGKHILWLQVRCVPGRIEGDAAGKIKSKDWDKAKERVADRVLDIVEEHAPRISSKVLARTVISPADLERENVNLVGGDHLGGSHHLSQHFLFRPVTGWSRYRTPVGGLFMTGSATWPGGGVGAGSGYLAAQEILHGKRSRRRRG